LNSIAIDPFYQAVLPGSGPQSRGADAEGATGRQAGSVARLVDVLAA
jgi:hypothetical protein